MKKMNNKETKEHLLKWCKDPHWGHFSWPTDVCGYDQHIRFVIHRNKNWAGGSQKEFIDFVKDYAISLK